jgi:hypothetical protein
MNETTYIYALVDPRNNAVRYVGKSDIPQVRLRNHLKPNLLKEKTKKNSWLKSLLRVGLKPMIRTIEEVHSTKWEERERFWIGHLTRLGERLTNGTPGGEGGAPSEEARRKISKALKGRTLPAEQIRKMSLARKGHRVTERTRILISQARQGHEVSYETRRKIGDANRGFRHTAAARKKIAAAGRGRRMPFAVSRYWGVSKDLRRHQFVGYLTVSKAKKVHLGNFPTEMEAARAHDVAADAYWGDNAILNFPKVSNRGAEPKERGESFTQAVAQLRTSARQSLLRAKASGDRSSRYRGVFYKQSARRWVATIMFEGRNFTLGHYPTEAEAASVYDQAAIAVRGTSAILNFPDSSRDVGESQGMDSTPPRVRLEEIRHRSAFRNKKDFRKARGASSPFLGVSFSRVRQSWHSYLTQRKPMIYIGRFATSIGAAYAHDLVARRVLGGDARVNFAAVPTMILRLCTADEPGLLIKQIRAAKERFDALTPAQGIPEAASIPTQFNQ